jgi:hypothetical protein
MSSDSLFDKVKEVINDLPDTRPIQTLVNNILEAFNKVEIHLLESKADKSIQVVRLWTGLEYEALDVGSLGPVESMENQEFLSALTTYLQRLSMFMGMRLSIMPKILNESHRKALKNSFNDILRVSRAFEFVNYTALALNGEEPPEEGPEIA